MKIIYTFKARQDLQNIYEYIAYTLLVPKTARRMTDTIMKEARTLDSMPEKNPLYKEEPWHSQGVHFLPVKKYLIFYTIDHDIDTVSISRIMYGGRDIRNQLSETKEW
ncbi:toxin ParE1/3/4 [Lachnospiraceae bacterium NK3A20]|nr:toxin ParE1/3/4 [Lachnospiraceae bacterium NK3A20]